MAIMTAAPVQTGPLPGIPAARALQQHAATCSPTGRSAFFRILGISEVHFQLAQAHSFSLQNSIRLPSQANKPPLSWGSNLSMTLSNASAL